MPSSSSSSNGLELSEGETLGIRIGRALIRNLYKDVNVPERSEGKIRCY